MAPLDSEKSKSTDITGRHFAVIDISVCRHPAYDILNELRYTFDKLATFRAGGLTSSILNCRL